MLRTALLEDCIRIACIATARRAFFSSFPSPHFGPVSLLAVNCERTTNDAQEFIFDGVQGIILAYLLFFQFRTYPHCLIRTRQNSTYQYTFASVVLPRPTRHRQQSWRVPDLMGVRRVRPPADIYPKTCSTTKMTMPTSRSDTHGYIVVYLRPPTFGLFPVPPSVAGVCSRTRLCMCRHQWQRLDNGVSAVVGAADK